MKIRIGIAAALLGALLALPALAAPMDAQTAQDWLAQFAAALASQPVRNAPQDTVDPARAGEYLLAYDFGTVRADVAQSPSADALREIDVRTAQVTDCRGKRVGMTLAEALDGAQIAQTLSPLFVLDTRAEGIGWSWAYQRVGEVYGLEYIAYGAQEDGMLREYTLTYVIESGAIAAIRMQMADATQAQAEEGLRTAQEIAGRQQGEALALANREPMLTARELRVQTGPALGEPVYAVVERMGEPVQVQTLPTGGGRMLVYEGAAIGVNLDAATSEEVVRSIAVRATGVQGPRGVCVGMSVQEAASLFRCDADTYAAGGTLYIEGEAEGEPPYGELTARVGDEAALRYACALATGETAWLDIGITGDIVTHWRLYVEEATAADGD